MPPTIAPKHIRALELMGQGKNVTDILTTQQQSGVSHTPAGTSANAVCVSNGTLFKLTGSEGGYTTGSGGEVLEGGKPVLRWGLITWYNAHTASTVTEAMWCALDAQGNVRAVWNAAGLTFYSASGAEWAPVTAVNSKIAICDVEVRPVNGGLSAEFARVFETGSAIPNLSNLFSVPLIPPENSYVVVVNASTLAALPIIVESSGVVKNLAEIGATQYVDLRCTYPLK